MSLPETTPQERLAALLHLFADNPLREEALEVIPESEVPEPYYGLLAHNHHMTVTLEARHHSPVELVVLEEFNDESSYARRLLLRTLEPAGADVVMAGMMRTRLMYCDPPVREAILACKTPLGRILIENEVLRWIEPEGYLRLRLDADGRNFFGTDTAAETYGRLATIYCNGEPAVELLEIIAPESGTNYLSRTEHGPNTKGAR